MDGRYPREASCGATEALGRPSRESRSADLGHDASKEACRLGRIAGCGFSRPLWSAYIQSSWGVAMFQVFSAWESPFRSQKAYLITMSFLLSIRISFLVKEKKNVELGLLSQDSQPSFPSRLNFIATSKSLCPRSHKLGVALHVTFGFCPPYLPSPEESVLSITHSHSCSSVSGSPEQ